MDAFAVFLTFQKALHQHYARANALTRLKRQSIPSDNPVRNLLDGVPTHSFDTLIINMLADTRAQGGLTEMQRLGGRTLIALNGTAYCRSERIACPAILIMAF